MFDSHNIVSGHEDIWQSVIYQDKKTVLRTVNLFATFCKISESRVNLKSLFICGGQIYIVRPLKVQYDYELSCNTIIQGIGWEAWRQLLKHSLVISFQPETSHTNVGKYLHENLFRGRSIFLYLLWRLK
jgi:hypothetical protein